MTSPPSTTLVGAYRSGEERHFLPVSLIELERARQFARRILESFGFAPGSYVVISSSHDEAAQLMPFDRAAVALGLIPCSTEKGAAEAVRVETAMRRFTPVAMARMDDAMAMSVDLDMLDGKVVWADGEAYRRLAAAHAIIARRWLDIGPAVAIECAEGAGAHIDRLEWQVALNGDELVLTSRLPRATPFTEWNSGIRCRIEHRPCACGNADPRIVPLDGPAT